MSKLHSARDYGHTFGEAFMLMKYECKCGHGEFIWNSRDGITPFATVCSSCKKLTLQHVMFHEDIYLPKPEPPHGQRFWRDGTPDEAEKTIRQRIKRMRGDFPLSKEGETNLISKSRSGELSEFQTGWPTLDRATKEPIA